MSSESEREEFFDAEDNTPVKSSRAKAKCSLPLQSLTKQSAEEPNSSKTSAQETPDLDSWEAEDVLKISLSSEAERKEIERKAHENEMRRRKLEEMRRKVQNDDDDSFYFNSQTCSQASSIDSLYLQHPTLKPEGEDSQSVVSLGKVGRILSGSESVSLQDHNVNSFDSGLYSGADSRSKLEEGQKGLHEPDVVASTKSDRLADSAAPKPPPRRKNKKKAKPLVKPLPPPVNVETRSIPSPASTVESIAKEFEHSLDLKSAIKGNKVVKPQDEEKDKAEGPPPVEHFIITGPLDIQDEEGLIQQLNMMVRTRTDSGKQLTDLEILEQVTVLNLDTGERIPLSLAEERLPRGINPLSLHIMRLTSEYVSNSSLDKHKESDEEIEENKKPVHAADSSGGSGTKKIRRPHITKFINRTVSKIKSVADDYYHVRRGDDQVESSEDEPITDPKHNIKFKAAGCHKGPYEFDNFKLIQDLSGEHSGAVWTMKFSYCGRLLATAGQDHILRVWVLRDAYDYFSDMRHRYNAETKVSPTPSQESLTSHQSTEDCDRMGNAADSESSEDNKSVFMPKPFCTYPGHTAEILDVSLSKNYFILSSSMDKTVRLWHISRRECLCCFQHIDFVTAIAFHPRDDRYFISGSLDGKLRLWNIPDKKVALWNELDGQTKLITAANFCQNGKFAVVGTYDGRCVFYNTEQLKYYTQIDVRSTRGKNAKGRKISGIEPMPGEDKILITSNDSRVRLYDLRDLSLSCKYKGYVNLSSQIRASFSHDGKFIVSGSENQCIYIWKTHHDYSKFSSARRDRNEFWEGIKGHNAVVTAAVFAPNPSIIFKQMEKFKGEEPGTSQSTSSDNSTGYVLVTADFNGAIKVFGNYSKIKT